MGYVDFHAHVLPAADHGSDCLETSLAQLKMAVDAGVSDIFTTPHFYVNADTIESFIERRERSFDLLQNAVIQQNIPIKLHRSCEVNMQFGLPSLTGLERLCIEDSRYMLIEMPFLCDWDEWIYESVDELRDRGIEPIIAHIDRYDEKRLDRLLEYNVLTQINAAPLSSLFKRRRIMQYVHLGLVHFYGSDIHMNGPQYTYYKKGESRLGPALLTHFSENAKKILRGESL